MALNVPKLIPGGEFTLVPAGPYTKKDGSTGQAQKKITISMGKVFFSLRHDLARALFEAIRDDAEAQEFIGVSL